MLRLLLARHGESEWQVLGDAAGTDSALTELGRRQAGALGRWLRGHVGLDHIYSSPLKRARETAELVAGHVELPVAFHPSLEESWFLIKPKLAAYPVPAGIVTGDVDPQRQVGEDYQRFRSQVVAALADILDGHTADATVLLVAHGGTISTIFRVLLGSDRFTVNVGNGTLTTSTAGTICGTCRRRWSCPVSAYRLTNAAHGWKC
jgi:broad specificity phosphatase PhoE